MLSRGSRKIPWADRCGLLFSVIVSGLSVRRTGFGVCVALFRRLFVKCGYATGSLPKEAARGE